MLIQDAMQPVALSKAYLLLNHGPVTLVSSAHNGRRNVMAAAWAMPLDFSPAKIAVVIDRQSFTRTLLEAEGHFALNIPCQAQGAMVLDVGSCSGRDEDKFARLGLACYEAQQVSAPLLEGCVGWLECRVRADSPWQHDLVLADVLAAWADAQVFQDGRWNFPDDASRTLHYVAGGQFFVTGSPCYPNGC